MSERKHLTCDAEVVLGTPIEYALLTITKRRAYKCAHVINVVISDVQIANPDRLAGSFSGVRIARAETVCAARP
jgi:hypothetical protein